MSCARSIGDEMTDFKDPETESHSPIAAALLRAEAQSRLFSDPPSRRQIMETQLPYVEAPVRMVNVWRNHAIEPILSLADPFTRYAGWRATFRISHYDDSLLFSDHSPSDAELLWLDSEPFLNSMDGRAWAEWLIARIHRLRELSPAPIIVATWLPEGADAFRGAIEAVPGVRFADIGAYCSSNEVSLIDRRFAPAAGTPLSRDAQLHLARKLACHWLPASLFPSTKAIALDLDNTLHQGVLGEDGVRGVVLTEGHLDLQSHLKSLRESGVFLALVSRNELEDVEALFREREDFPLKWSDFSATEISWGAKPEALKKIAQKLRIGTDAILFIDDNPGEVAAVAGALPDIRTLHAKPEPQETLCALGLYPGLWRWAVGSDDLKRVEDLNASAERDILRSSAADPEEYLRSLQISLTYRVDPVEQVPRLADLSRKTNQFNLALQRYDDASLARLIDSKDASIVSVALKDRLSDAGVIALVVGVHGSDTLRIREICVSCRALGRELEHAIVIGAIRSIPGAETCRKVTFDVEYAPRNQPALEWLQRIAPDITAGEPNEVSLPADMLWSHLMTDHVTTIHE